MFEYYRRPPKLTETTVSRCFNRRNANLRVRTNLSGMATRVCVVGSANMDMTFDVATLAGPGRDRAGVVVELRARRQGRQSGGGRGTGGRAGTVRRRSRRRPRRRPVASPPARQRSRAGRDHQGARTERDGGHHGRRRRREHHRGGAGRQRTLPDGGTHSRRRLRCAVDPIGDSGGDGGRAARQARAAGAVVWSMPHRPVQDRSPLAELAATVDVVIANEREADRLGMAANPFGDYPWSRAAPATSAPTASSRYPPRKSRRWTRPVPATCSPECWPRIGHPSQVHQPSGCARCSGPAPRARWQRWSAAPATAHRTPKQSKPLCTR